MRCDTWRRETALSATLNMHETTHSQHLAFLSIPPTLENSMRKSMQRYSQGTWRVFELTRAYF